MEETTCPTCGGEGMYLGRLGYYYFRCRDCGRDFYLLAISDDLKETIEGAAREAETEQVQEDIEEAL